jgi:hypothetical protein
VPFCAADCAARFGAGGQCRTRRGRMPIPLIVPAVAVCCAFTAPVVGMAAAGRAARRAARGGDAASASHAAARCSRAAARRSRAPHRRRQPGQTRGAESQWPLRLDRPDIRLQRATAGAAQSSVCCPARPSTAGTRRPPADAATHHAQRRAEAPQYEYMEAVDEGASVQEERAPERMLMGADRCGCCVRALSRVALLPARRSHPRS